MKSLIVIAMLLASSLAAAHSGGTDSNGCHRDTKTNTSHCH